MVDEWRWTILVNDLTDAVKKAPWGGRYLLGARLHQIGAELDPLLKATGNEARVREQFAKIDAVQKEPQWKELATASEQSDAVRMRLRIHAYLKDKAQLQTELGNAIRQAQLESAVNDLRVYYLMRADSGYEALKALKADTPEAQTLATQTFMDYLRIHMLYAEQAGDHTPVVALRLAELYHRIKGPDWYERAQELAEEARKAPATRAQAEQLLTQIRADAPADAKDAAPGAK